VIEDDLVLDERFGSVTAGLRAKCTFDVVFLGTSSRNLSTRNRVAVENGIYLHRPVGAVYNTWGYVITRRYGESLLQRLQQVRWPIDHVLGGRIGALRPRLAVLQPPVVQEDRELGLQSQIEPYTFRLDRLRLIEHTRRRLLDSPVGDLYSRFYQLF
jgi:GR25 family glycosyltransferase involved in LPS biosynthesis